MTLTFFKDTITPHNSIFDTFARKRKMRFTGLALILAVPSVTVANEDIVTLGTRPYYLVDEMKASPLKDTLREF